MLFFKKHPSYSDLNPEVSNSLRYSVKDGAFHAVMLGTGEAYLSAFAIFLGANSLILGLISSVPLLVGSLAQIASLNLIKLFSLRKKIVVRAAFLQGLTWIPLYILPILVHSSGPIFLFSFCIIYYLLAHLVAPAWNSWMGDLVPAEKRGHYFGHRNQLRTFFQLFSFLSAGLILYLFDEHQKTAIGFGLLFGIASLVRLISARYLSKMVEPTPYQMSDDDSFTFIEFVAKVRTSNFTKYSFYVAFLLFATNIASPFFTLYMLRDLKMSYLTFSGSLAMSLLGQIVTFQNWGKIGDRFGNRKITELTGFLVSAVPLLWLTTTNFLGIYIIQFISGIFWAGFNLCSVNFIFDAVTPQKRSRCIAYYNVLAYCGVFLGSLIGGWMAPHLPRTFFIFGHQISFFSSLHVLFILSALARLVPSILLIPFIKEVREIDHVPSWQIIRHLISLYFNPEFGTRLMSILSRKQK